MHPVTMQVTPSSLCPLWRAAAAFLDTPAVIVAPRPLLCHFEVDGFLLRLSAFDPQSGGGIGQCNMANPPFLVRWRHAKSMLRYLHRGLAIYGLFARYLHMSVPLLAYFIRHPDLAIAVATSVPPPVFQGHCTHVFRWLYVFSKRSLINFRAVVEPGPVRSNVHE